MTHRIDLHVGQRIRGYRRLARLTQRQLGNIVGIKFQQIQKYETGANRVSASRLYEIAKALDVPVSAFFEAIEPSAADTRASAETAPETVSTELFSNPEALEFVSCYFRLSQEPRRRLLELTRSLAEAA